MDISTLATPTVSDQIIAVLDALCRKFGVVIDWTQNNIMPYLQSLVGKIINYEVATSFAWIGIFIIFIAAAWIGFAIYRKHNKYYDDVFYILITVAIGITVIGVSIICYQIFDIVTCYTLPEKIILRFIQTYTSK